MSPLPLLALSSCPVRAARLFTPRIVGYEPESLVLQIIPPPNAPAPFSMGLTDFDVWYDGEPDVVYQRSAANSRNARESVWLLNPRREFWRIKARPSSASKGAC